MLTINKRCLKLESLIVLTESERQLLQFSLPKLNNNLDFLVNNFYKYFLKTDAGILFQHTNMKNQQKMFASSINVITTNIANPQLLGDTLDNLIAKHIDYGVMSKHADDFVNSFMKALGELFNTEKDQQILHLWQKVISNIMDYFKDHL